MDSRAAGASRLRHSINKKGVAKMMGSNVNQDCNRGLSLLEVLAVVVLLGIVAMIVVPRFSGSAENAKVTGCHVNKGNIEVQASLWFRNKGTWPDSNLANIFADSDYFPDGATTCPVDGSSYTFDSSTEQVVGHTH